MNQKYQMLMGRQFALRDDVYTVCKILCVDNRFLVEAVDSAATQGPQEKFLFPAEKVLERLVVDEEIELYPPTFLGSGGKG
jgi:hypothetical protein